jgi:hypothetical protein
MPVIGAYSAALPVLGRTWGPYQRGYGEVKPYAIDNGGDPTGIVEHVHWRSWGADRAVGHGVGYFQPPGKIVADSVVEPASVVAFDLGTCNGLRAYNAIQWYYPQHGEKFDPTRWYINICTGQHFGNG